MAAEDAQGAQIQPSGSDAPCPPCRSTGRLISNLGGEAKEVQCPWCEGSGRLLGDHDAQAARRAEQEGGREA